MINFSDFQKLDLRVGKVLEAEKIQDADKLLKLQVDLGEEKRQLVAGLSKSYTPDNLIGKNIVVVYNLEPKELMGVESQGMLLAASSDGEHSLITTDSDDVSPGSKIR